MATPLTLAAVRDRLYTFSLPGDDKFDANFLVNLNEVRERIFARGKWSRLTSVLDFASSTGYISLPYRFESVLAVQIKDVPTSINGKYYEYQQGGYGNLNTDGSLGMLIDQGFHPVETDITTAGTIRITFSAADVAATPTATLRIEGLDADGDVVYDSTGSRGIDVAMTAVTMNTSQTFSKITSITKPATLDDVTVSVVVSGTATEIAVIEAGAPCGDFHRYKVGTIDADEEYPTVIRCQCKLRYIPLEAETDVVLPPNVSALKFGLMAVAAEAQNDLKTANDHWQYMDSLLDNELKEARGGATLRVRFSPNSGLPKVRFIR